MKTILKMVLSVIALAALVAAPAVAKSRTQRPTAPTLVYSNNTVSQGGKLLGADPDPRVRFEIRRDARYWLDE
jgi:hypothetical protein